MCKKLLPVARSFARSERQGVAIVLMGDGDRPSHEALVAEHRLEDVPFALAPIVGINLGIGRLPHAVLIDAAGIDPLQGHRQQPRAPREPAGRAGDRLRLDAGLSAGQRPRDRRRPARQPDDGRISA